MGGGGGDGKITEPSARLEILIYSANKMAVQIASAAPSTSALRIGCSELTSDDPSYYGQVLLAQTRTNPAVLWWLLVSEHQSRTTFRTASFYTLLRLDISAQTPSIQLRATLSRLLSPQS